MIKKLLKSIWLIASLSAIFISCDKDDNIGAGLQSEEGLFSHFALEEDGSDIINKNRAFMKGI